MNPRYAVVAERAGHRCEYCRAPEAVFNFPFVVEHIIPIVELNAEGTDYLVQTDETGKPLVKNWPQVQYMLGCATERLTLQAMLAQWPTDGDRPDPSTLSRWLKRAVEQRLVCRAGSGYCGDAFRYWLSGREPLLWPGDRATEAEKQAWRERCYADAQRRRGGGASA